MHAHLARLEQAGARPSEPATFDGAMPHASMYDA
jgi:hypothetical protein